MKNYVNYLLFVFCAVFVFYLIQKRKVYWDAIPYMGAVIAIDESDAKLVHQYTYNHVQNECTAAEQQKLIYDHPFCKSIFETEAYFTQQLPFFKVKLLYVWMSYLPYKLGVPLYFSLYLIVLLSSVLLIFVSYKWLNKYHGNLMALLLTMLIFLCWFNMSSFQISSPDAPAGLFFMAAVYFYLVKNKLNVTYLFLFLAALTRPDYLFFVLCFYGVSIWVSKTKPAAIPTMLMLLCIASIFLISFIYQYHAWHMFYRSFIELTVSPQTDAGVFGLKMYLKGLLNGIQLSLGHKSTYLFLALLIIPMFYLKKLTVNEKIVFIALLTSVFIKFMIHPWLEERFVFIYIDLFIIMFLTKLDVKKLKQARIK